MRDIVVTLLILGMLPLAVKRPWIGVLVFVWLSLMTPHRFAYGFAYDFPFAAVVALVTFVGLVLTKDEVRYEPHPALVFMLLLPLWTCVTYLFAFEPASASGRLVEVLKIFLFVHVSAMVLKTRQHVEWMLWVIVVSVGFYGVKGGAFTIATLGESKVWGPPGDSFLSDNNAIAVALIMVIPLMHYLRTIATSVWIRRGLLASMLLCGVSVLGTYSRGGLLAASAMLLFLWLKSSRKMMFALIALPLLPVAISFMPEKWMGRMNTISTYEQDGSAMGRINSWMTAINIANDRPLVGGGFEFYGPAVFARYAPDPNDIHSAHSIYFQMLGEHGYVGLLIFLSIGIAAWITGRRTIALAKDRPEMQWAAQMARAIQVSLIGYAVGGAFVNIGYWDMVYYEVLLLVVVRRLVSVRGPGPASAASWQPSAGRAA